MSEEDDPVRRHRRYVARAFSQQPAPYYGYKHGNTLFFAWIGSWLVFWVGLFSWVGGNLDQAVMAGVVVWLLIGVLAMPFAWYELVGTDRRDRG